MIASYEFLGLIDEPNWKEFADQFDESGFEIYSTRALVEIEENEPRDTLYNIQAKLNTSKALDQIRLRFFELSEFANQLDLEEKDRLFKRWEEEVKQCSKALIGWSLDEWIKRDKHVILF